MTSVSASEEILVLHGGALGDCVLAIHFARAIRTVAPPTVGPVAPPLVGGAPCQASVTIAARSSIVHWASKHRLIDAALSLDVILKEPRSFDRVISFLGDSTAAASGNLRASAPGEVECIDPRPADSGPLVNLHIVDQWCARFGALDPNRDVHVARPGGAPHECGGSDSRKTLMEKIDTGAERIVLIHPGSGGLSKCCPLEALIGLIPALNRENWSVAWMIGPDEVERFGDGYAEKLRRHAPVVYEESVETAADLAAAVDAYIGCDAGMTHVAALAGVPTVALFGPSDPRVWRPLGSSVQVLPFPDPNRPTDNWTVQVVSAASVGAP